MTQIERLQYCITKSERKALLKALNLFEHAKLGCTLSKAIEWERRKKDSYLIKVDNKPLKTQND